MINFDAVIESCEEYGLDFEYHHIDDKEVRLIFKKAGHNNTRTIQRVMERVFPLEYKDNISYCSDFDGTLHYELMHFSHILEADKNNSDTCVTHVKSGELYDMNKKIKKQLGEAINRAYR